MAFIIYKSNGNGIFICPLHIIIQYSAVLLPPPALISHCDQEKKLYNNVMHTDILPWNSFLQYLHGDTMIYMGKIRTRNICLFFCFVILFASFIA